MHGVRKARINILTLLLITTTLGTIFTTGLRAPLPDKSSVAPTISTPPSGTYFDHMIIIVMENEGVFDICKQSPPPCSTSGPAPFMASLANNYTIGSQYLALVSTSQPNYVALLSGSMQGCTANGCPSPITAPNLVDRVESSGLTWKGYMENQTARGCDLSSPEPYTPIHNPFIVFQDITNNTARCNKIVDANPLSCGTVVDCSLVNDLNNATSAAPNFMWLTPNDCDNMRGNAVCNNPNLIGPGDTYLSKLVPKILNSRTFNTTRSALFITFDEGNSFCPLNGSSENCVYASWSGPSAKTQFGSSNLYDHYSFTKTVETNWGFAPFTMNDQNANPMAEFFKAQVPDFTISANPASQTTPTGVKANTTLTLASINSFNGTVTLSATSTPNGPSLTLTPTSVILTKGHSSTSTLTFQTSTLGTYSVLAKGTSGTLSHNTTVTITVAAPDFAISANPSSLTIGQLSSTANNPIPVNQTGDRTFFESSYLPQSFYAQGRIWLFYEDTRFNCEHTLGCLTYTSSTNGTKWTTPTRLSLHITDSDFSVATNGTSIFYARYNETSYDSNCGRNLQFGQGTLATTGTITWQPEQTVFTGATNRAYPDDMITIDSTGRAWIAYMIDNKSSCGGSGTQRPQIIHSTGTNYAIWTGNTTLCLAACHSLNEHIDLTPLSNGQIYALYWVSKFGIHGRLFNGTTWGSEEALTSNPTDVNDFLFNSGNNLYAIYFDNTTATYNFATRSPTGTWTINLIGSAETHTGTSYFNPAYYSLPDAASYDSKDNLFVLFYMNATTQTIDQWSGFGGNWTKTSGLLSVSNVPYADSINSFIQSTPVLIGEIYYISGSASPFTINSASITFTAAGNTGTTKITITSKNGFTGTVNLTTSVKPTTGLTVNCTPTTIPNGSGSSTCTLTSTLQGNYNVTIKGTSGTLNHNTTIMVRSLATPDFTLTTSALTPTLVSQTLNSTITIKAINGFAGTISLSDTIPSGLTCGQITPNTVAGSGNATVSCSSSLYGNYTLTVKGTSTTLSHNSTIIFRFQDFTLTATPASRVEPNIMASSIITYTGLNHFNATVTLTGSASAGLTCSIAPSTITRSTAATAICTSPSTGNYNLNITGTVNSLSHTATLIIHVDDFSITGPPSSITLPIGTNTTTTMTLASLNSYSGNLTITPTDQASGIVNGGGSVGGRTPFINAPPSSMPTLSISPTTIILPSGGTRQANLTILLTLNVPLGTYIIVVTATDGTVSHQIQITLTVTDFSFTTPNTSVTVHAGNNSTQTLTLQSLNGFQGNITLTWSFNPTGPSATLNPSSFLLTTTKNSTLTIIVPITTPPGNYTLTVQATSKTLSHTLTIMVTVPVGLTAAPFATTLATNLITPLSILGTAAGLVVVSIRRTTTCDPTSTGRRRLTKSGNISQNYPGRQTVWTYPIPIRTSQLFQK